MKTLAIDYGTKRIGLAISDKTGLIASAMPTFQCKSFPNTISKLQRIIKSQGVKNLLIGLALDPQGEETQQSIRTRYFASALKQVSHTTIEFKNEAFSTQQAKFSNPHNTRKQIRNLDSQVARNLLQEHLNSQNNSEYINYRKEIVNSALIN